MESYAFFSDMENDHNILPSVAPHDSCVACLRGDTPTILALQGSAEFHIAFLEGIGIPRTHVLGLISITQDIEYGFVPSEPYIASYRMCRDCAKEVHLHVLAEESSVNTNGVPLYTEEAFLAAAMERKQHEQQTRINRREAQRRARIAKARAHRDAAHRAAEETLRRLPAPVKRAKHPKIRCEKCRKRPPEHGRLCGSCWKWEHRKLGRN
jgi:hypothetical protein